MIAQRFSVLRRADRPVPCAFDTLAGLLAAASTDLKNLLLLTKESRRAGNLASKGRSAAGSAAICRAPREDSARFRSKRRAMMEGSARAAGVIALERWAGHGACSHAAGAGGQSATAAMPANARFARWRRQERVYARIGRKPGSSAHQVAVEKS